MGELVKLPSLLERGAHLSGECLCANCGHQWVAVVPVGVIDLECPECHTMKGVFKYGCEPKTAWVCNCGCYLFTLSPKGIICWKCGTYQTWAG